MAKVKGPLLSLEASGTIRKTIVFSQWKGRNYVRGHVIPFNPQSSKQTNVRAAMTLLVLEWQGEIQGYKDTWAEYGKTYNLSGFNTYVKRGMNAYITQLGTDTTPASVAVTGDPPADVWVWA